MNISVKVKNSIIAQLDKVKHDTFQEEDIKELIRDIRPMLPKESLLRELADFFSHPEGKDRGIFNKALNSRYLKFKLMDEQRDKLDQDQVKGFKTERQHTDFLLNGINIERVEKKLFDILFKDGLNDLSEGLFKKNYPLSKKKVRKLISDSYQLAADKKSYQLKNSKEYALIEDALKFIRGAIEAQTIFNSQRLEKEFQTAINNVVSVLNLDSSYRNSTKMQSKLILLCIICLLHDAKFVFHDKHVATCFLSLYPINSESIGDRADKNSLIGLTSDNVGAQMPIVVTNLKIGQFMQDNEEEIGRYRHMERIPWINARRDIGNALLLTA